MKIKTKEEIENIYLGLKIAFGFLLIISGVFIFYIGFHNLDLSVNMLKVSYDYKLDFYKMFDTTLGEETISYTGGYILGCRQIILAFFMTLIGALLYGINFAKFWKEYKCLKKK